MILQTTARLELAPVREDDVPALLALFRDPEVRRYLLDGRVVEEAWVRGEVEASRQRFTDGGAGLWAIRRRGEAAVVGFVGFRAFFDPPRMQLLYGLSPSSWGRGYATEAAEAACRYAFDVLGWDEVAAATDLPNAASIRVLERLGMARRETTDEGA